MSLLSAADDRAIRDAIKLTTDTFMVTPVAYHQSTGALDAWEEDKDNENFNTLNLKGLEEYPKNDGNKVKEAAEGNIDLNDVELSFNVEDLEALDLFNPDWSHKLNAETDYFTLKGTLYRVTDIYFDGPLSEKPALIIITGKFADTPKNVSNG